MCWSFEVSLSAFAIGSAFNVFILSQKTIPMIVRVLCGLWQYVLCMQLFEAIAWKTQSPKSKSMNILSGKLAMFFNITQPLVLGGMLLLFCRKDISQQNANISVIIMGVYGVWLVYNILNRYTPKAFTPGDGCSHLDLSWWKDFKFNAVPYLITLGLVIGLLIRPLNLMWFQLSFVAISFIASYMFYGCSVGSMWCFFAAFAPVLLYVYTKKYKV